MSEPRGRLAAGTTSACVAALVSVLVLVLAACSNPTVPATPTAASGSGTPRASANETGLASSSPGPIGTPRGSIPPTPQVTHIGTDPCRLLTLAEVNAALGGGYDAPYWQGITCIFPADAASGGSAIVSVAVAAGDVITPIRSRYGDLQNVPATTGSATWSASVATLWLVPDAAHTIILSMPGKDLPDDQLKAAALQLAQLAVSRI